MSIGATQSLMSLLVLVVEFSEQSLGKFRKAFCIWLRKDIIPNRPAGLNITSIKYHEFLYFLLYRQAPPMK